MFRWISKTLVLSASVLLLAACTIAPLKPAAPISVPTQLSQMQVRNAIITSLTGRGWTIDHSGHGNILSTLNLRGHSATIRVNYNRSTVSIAYVSSSDLEYRLKDGKPYIHRNYNGWIGYLEQDIRRNLQNTHYLGGK